MSEKSQLIKLISDTKPKVKSEVKFDFNKRTSRDINEGLPTNAQCKEHLNKIKNQKFDKIKENIYEKRRMKKNENLKVDLDLFTDDVFSIKEKELFEKDKSKAAKIKFRRAKDIAKDKKLQAKLNTENPKPTDLQQGDLDNCWFIVACAAISQNQNAFNLIVPNGQSFNDDDKYIGAFYFSFFIYGTWYDVVVDDYLPVDEQGDLIFCRNPNEPNEFWGALIEKAYAKVYGSYDSLNLGTTADAFSDLTGEIVVSFEIKNYRDKRKTVEEQWADICSYIKFQPMITLNIFSEAKHGSSLSDKYQYGHCYTVTGINQIEKTIKIFNPSNNKVKEISRSEIYNHFDGIQFCITAQKFFTPNQLGQSYQSIYSCKFDEKDFAWSIKENTAVGAKSIFDEKYFENPKFLISLKQPPVKDTSENLKLNNDFAQCIPPDNSLPITAFISLKQKFVREKCDKTGNLIKYIRFSLFKILEEQKNLDIHENFDFTHYNYREVTGFFYLTPGDYLIVPSCAGHEEEAEFLLRIVTNIEIDYYKTKNVEKNESEKK